MHNAWRCEIEAHARRAKLSHGTMHDRSRAKTIHASFTVHSIIQTSKQLSRDEAQPAIPPSASVYFCKPRVDNPFVSRLILTVSDS